MKKELSPAEAQKLLKAYRNLAKATDHHFERAASTQKRFQLPIEKEYTEVINE